MYKNLSEFIDLLERRGELVRVRAEVDPVLEIAEITDRESKRPDGGRALLFERTGTAFPVLTNMFGSDRRMALALGVENLDDVPERMEGLFVKVLNAGGRAMDRMRMLPLLGEVSRWFPKTLKKRGECQQTILKGDAARLSLLPILKCWPEDGGRFVTLPMVTTTDPDTGTRNVGMYRMQVTGEHTTGMHWHMHKTGARHYEAYKRRGERMPVSVCLGGDPVYTYAATAPMPDNMDEWLLAGFLRRRAVKMVKCVTNDLYVPGDCDFVIEGYVDPAQEKFTEGPFGDHTGFYSLEDQYPEFHVTAITHRRGAVWPATLVGIPPQEDAQIARATEKIFLAPIRLALQPEITDLYMPQAGISHNLALLSIRRSYPGQAMKVAAAMWGAGQMMFNKMMLVADEQDDIRDPATVARLVRSADLTRDVMFSRGVLDILDHAVATPGEGGKVALDLTGRRPEREIRLPARWELPQWAEGIDPSPAKEWGAVVVYADRVADVDGAGLVRANPVDGLNFIVIADPATRVLAPRELLWFAAGNTDPGRDMVIVDGTMVIDARTKAPKRAGYPERVPNAVVAAQETVELVDRRWEEYGIGERLSSPSEHYRSLTYGDGAEVE